MENKDEFKFEITKHYGNIAEGKGGWNVELNEVSWNERPAKFDIRSWAPDHKKMGKGITFTKEELASLKNLLSSIEL